jgi:hypothetical protein
VANARGWGSDHGASARKRQPQRPKAPAPNPCTAEPHYTEEKGELFKAAEAYKKKYRKRFLSLSDMYEVMHGLGYRQVEAPYEP